jgi:hypothetical protein
MYVSSLPGVALYTAKKGQITASEVNPEFDEFQILDESVGPLSAEKMHPRAPYRLTPGKYRIEAIGRKGERATRWRVERSGLFSGSVRLQEGRDCEVELKRGERVVISVAQWEAANEPLIRSQRDGSKLGPKSSGSPSTRDELERLNQLQEQEVGRVKERYKAGAVAHGDVVAAEIQLLELRNRLNIAEGKSIVPALKELVAKAEEMRDLVKELFSAGKVSASEMTAAEKAVSEARIRLREAEARSK